MIRVMPLIAFILVENSRVDSVAFAQKDAGVTVVIKLVLLFPFRVSFMRYVSFDLSQGMSTLRPNAANVFKTRSKVAIDLSPLEVMFRDSEPAISTNITFEFLTFQQRVC